jgi:MFS family permease
VLIGVHLWLHHSSRTGAERRMPRPKLFYGWYVLAACVVIELFGLGFGVFAITTVYPYIIDTFPTWSRTVVFAPTSVIISVVGLMSPVIGILIDRYPIRIVFCAGIVVQCAALYLFSMVQTPVQYLSVSGLLGFGMSAVTILPNQVLVSRWFHQRVGLVNGIVLAATALGAAIAPAAITRFIEVSDWRTAFRWMSLLALGPPLLVVLTIIRDRPAAMGLRAHGTAGDAASDAAARAAHATDLTLRDALRLPTFWIFGAAVFLGGMPCYSYNKHILVQLKELGYPPIQAADYKSLFFLVSACSRVSFGWLCDRFDKRTVVLLHFALIAGGYPLILFVPQHRELLVPCLVIVGVGYGGLLPSMPILSVHYFGRSHLGTILGVYKIAYDAAAAGAPLFTAYLYDRYGTYAVPDLWNTLFAWIGVSLVFFGLKRSLAPRGVAGVAEPAPG